MSPEQYQKVKSLFNSALELSEADREKYLSENCDGNSDLRKAVERLLTSHENSNDFIESPAIAHISENILDDKNNDSKNLRLGNYKIEREIGRGGMGSVYLATRSDEQFNKRVAIKILRRGMDTEDILRRFRNERRILAALDHPNIARLLDAGTTDDGLPYFVMEYVEGEPLDKYCDEHNLDTRERLQLFRKVCSAVQYAHQNLIVHRDLKPSNIIVTDKGEPKLLDFGIAKLLNPELTAHTIAPTATFVRLMTPDYASPEQIRGKNITTASDVYSLGILLYKLLTGQQPYNFQDSSPQEIERIICESQPTKPSAVFRSQESGVRSHGLADKPENSNPKSKTQNLKSLKGDLDNIVLMALRKEPERRYRSVENFSQDIERYLQGLPVAARPNTFGYRAEKFVKRNKVGVIAASLITLAVLAGLIATVWQARVAARERDQARREQVKAEQLNNFLQTILSSASPEEKGRDAKVIEVLSDAAQNIDTQFANQPELKAQALLTIGQTYFLLGLPEQGEKVLSESLKINTELYGEEHKDTASSMSYLGAVLLAENKYDEAEKLLIKAIEIERRFSFTQNKELPFALNALGELYVRKAEFEKGKSMLQEAVVLYDKLSGKNNPDSAFALISLGRAQAFSGDVVAAENTYRQSIAIYRQLSTRYQIRLSTVLLNLGNLQIAKGNYNDGINTMLEADGYFQKQSGSYFSFASKTYLCSGYFFKGDYEHSIEEGRKGIEIGRKLHLENGPDFIAALEHVGLALTRTGEAKEGEPVLRESLELVRKHLANDKPSNALVEGALGECLTAQNKFAEAEPLLIKSYETLKTIPGEKSPQFALASKRAVELYEKWRKPDLANKYRTTSAQTQK